MHEKWGRIWRRSRNRRWTRGAGDGGEVGAGDKGEVGAEWEVRGRRCRKSWGGMLIGEGMSQRMGGAVTRISGGQLLVGAAR